MHVFAKTMRLKLKPNVDQRAQFMRFSGSCRWLWNQFLAMNRDRYAVSGEFIFRYDMQKMIPGLKAEYEWLKETPSESLQAICKVLSRALTDSFKPDSSGKTKGFPSFKSHRDSKRSFYIANNKFYITGNHIHIPKAGKMRFYGRVPRGKILGATVTLVGNDWYCMVQYQEEVDIQPVKPQAATVEGVDAGLKAALTVSNGMGFDIPPMKPRARKRIKRLNQQLARSSKRSQNREKIRSRLRRAYTREADLRRDIRHKTTRTIVNAVSALVIETLNVKGISQALNLGKRAGEVGLGEALFQLDYKCKWAGKTVLRADRFFPSTQTCSNCGVVKQGDERLQLKHRIYKCGACGHSMDRDLNAAMNLRLMGLKDLALTDMETQGAGVRSPDLEGAEHPSGRNACGGTAVGVKQFTRHVPVKQESSKCCPDNI